MGGRRCARSHRWLRRSASSQQAPLVAPPPPRPAEERRRVGWSLLDLAQVLLQQGAGGRGTARAVLDEHGDPEIAWVPIIQAWERGGLSLPYSAVLIFATTGSPGTPPRKVAEPSAPPRHEGAPLLASSTPSGWGGLMVGLAEPPRTSTGATPDPFFHARGDGGHARRGRQKRRQWMLRARQLRSGLLGSRGRPSRSRSPRRGSSTSRRSHRWAVVDAGMFTNVPDEIRIYGSWAGLVQRRVGGTDAPRCEVHSQTGPCRSTAEGAGSRCRRRVQGGDSYELPRRDLGARTNRQSVAGATDSHGDELPAPARDGS
ncbi:hypothetical protein ABIB53_000942 [Janibacter sp. UYMM211]